MCIRDRLTCGWQPGEEIVIAARPAVGKTAFELHLARTAASAGYHIAVYSLEMLGERLGDRWLLAATTGVNPDHLRSGQLTPSELRQVHELSLIHIFFILLAHCAYIMLTPNHK